VNRAFWKGRPVMVTGMTGFKGSWLALWLARSGAKVSGYALAPPTMPSLFERAKVGTLVESTNGDVRSLAALKDELTKRQPEVIIHLAAQPIVRTSYESPVETFETNVMGTVNVLEAARTSPHVKVVVVVTSDKCYEDQQRGVAYREDDRLGGHDPYATSKACAELVAESYRRSLLGETGPAVVTARAGNVIGGGDWARDRLIPDIVTAFASGRPAIIRNPACVRPWQHVLDPLAGYLLLAERAWESRSGFSSAWNFGPPPDAMQPVSAVVEDLCRLWGGGARWERDGSSQPHETLLLTLDSAKAREKLGWAPRLAYADSLRWTADWYRQVANGGDARTWTVRQIETYEEMAA